MSETKEKKTKFDGEEVEVLGATYEDGFPEEADRWRNKMYSRENMLKYIKTSLRYWYGGESGNYGSEKRRNPA